MVAKGVHIVFQKAIALSVKYELTYPKNLTHLQCRYTSGVESIDDNSKLNLTTIFNTDVCARSPTHLTTSELEEAPFVKGGMMKMTCH